MFLQYYIKYLLKCCSSVVKVKQVIAVPVSKTTTEYSGLHQSDLLVLRGHNLLHEFPNILYKSINLSDEKDL